MLLSIKNLQKSYGKKVLYRDLSLNVCEREVFALIGPNGVGKTSLMRMILGWDRDYSGLIEWKKGIRMGYSPESPNFSEILSGRELLEYYLEMEGYQKEDRRKRALELMGQVGLSLEEDTKISHYSKGMKQRLGVAQALIGDPDLILLDEPSAGLDFFGQVQMQELIGSLKDQGKGILLNSHLLHDVERICDRGIIVMGPNKIRFFDRQDFGQESLSDMFIGLAEEE